MLGWQGYMSIEYGDAQILPATLADCVDIAAINQEVFVQTYADVTPEATEEALCYHVDDNWLARKIAYYENSLRNGARLSIAKMGLKSVGFAMAGSEFGLYVLPEYQRSTVGLRLAMTLAPEIEQSEIQKITFTVVLGTAAVQFYERLGCKPTGRDISAELPVLRGGQVLPQVEMELSLEDALLAREHVGALLAKRH